MEGAGGGRRPARPWSKWAQEDEGLAAEVPENSTAWKKMLAELELKALLSGPLDGNSALLTINARNGGTDANDWAEMLLADVPGLGPDTSTRRKSSTARTTRRPASTAPRWPSAARWPTAT